MFKRKSADELMFEGVKMTDFLPYINKEENLMYYDLDVRLYKEVLKVVLECHKRSRIVDFSALKLYIVNLYTLPDVTVDRAISKVRDELDL